MQRSYDWLAVMRATCMLSHSTARYCWAHFQLPDLKFASPLAPVLQPFERNPTLQAVILSGMEPLAALGLACTLLSLLLATSSEEAVMHREWREPADSGRTCRRWENLQTVGELGRPVEELLD